MGFWQTPSTGHEPVDSVQDQFPEGNLGLMEQLKSRLSQQDVWGLVRAALWFCIWCVNHRNCFLEEKPVSASSLSNDSKLGSANRLWPLKNCKNYKKIKESTVLSSSQITRSISERCQWLVHLRQHLPTTWEGTPQHPITALSTVWVVRVSITSVLPGRTKAFTRTS